MAKEIKEKKNFSSLEDLGIAFGFEPEPKEEPKVTVIGSSETVKVSTSPIDVTTGIQVVPKVTERNITVPLGRGRESYTVYYKWLIHHKPGCVGPSAWEFTKFNDRELRYPVKKNGKVLDLWINEHTHNSQLRPERPVKVSSLSSAPEITISNCTARYKISTNKLYSKELNELIDKLNRISDEYEHGQYWDKIYSLDNEIEDFEKLEESDTYLDRYNDFEGTFGVAPDTYQDKWEDDRIDYDQIAELREKFDIEKEISKLQEEIDKIHSEEERVENKYKQLAEGLKKFTFKRLTLEDWLHSLVGGERNTLNSTKEEDLPEWDYHDPNALVIWPAANWYDGNIWGKKKPFKLSYSDSEYYSNTTLTFIIDSDGKFWKYPKLSELAELKVSEDFKNKMKKERGYYSCPWLHGPFYKNEEKTYIDPEFKDNVNVGLYDYCRILGVAGWVREGRKGKAELVFLPTNECK
jgi:hypothetical protein